MPTYLTGYKETIYRDTEGYLTFGIGHRITTTDPEHGKPIGYQVTPTRIQEERSMPAVKIDNLVGA